MDDINNSIQEGRLLEVCFIPVWPKNPYHAQLIRHLATKQVHVNGASSLKQLTAEILAGRLCIDILHLHAVPSFQFSPLDLVRVCLNFRRLQILRRAGVRVILTVHDLLAHETRAANIDLLFGRITSRLTDAIIVHSQTSKNILPQAWNIKEPEKIHVLPHPHFIDCYNNSISREESRRRFCLRNGETVFLFLGLIRPYKGVEDLIVAFRSIRNSNLRLIIAGEPLTPQFGKKLSMSIAEDRRIQFFPGFVAPNDVQVFMNASDAVVFPYRKIFTSGALVLAMSFGKACVATATGSLDEILPPEGGFLCAPNNPDSLRAALLKAAETRSELGNMGKRNRDRAQQWSWEAMAQQTAELYRSVQKNHPGTHSSHIDDHCKDNSDALRNNTKNLVQGLL